MDEPQIQGYSLDQFVQRAGELYHQAEHSGDSYQGKYDDFVQFALSGRDTDGTQASIDPYLNHLSIMDAPGLGLVGTRDYDSFIGLSDKIEVGKDGDFTFFFIPKYDDTLKKDLKIKYTYITDEGLDHAIPLHKCPNVCIAKFGTHTTLRMFIPGLIDTRELSQPYMVSLDEQKILCDDGYIPSFHLLLETRSDEFPPDFKAEMARARKGDGTFNFGGKTLPDYALPQLGQSIRECLTMKGHAWASTIFFMHEIRGVKGMTFHASGDPVAARERLESVLQTHHLPELDRLMSGHCGTWYADVGLQVSLEGDVGSTPPNERHSLAWDRRQHSTILSAIGGVPIGAAMSMCRVTSGKYYVDLASHLTEVAGCRVSPGSQGSGPFGLVYWQMYHTDKAFTYNLQSDRVSKSISGSQVLRGKADGYLDDVYGIYRSASSSPNSLRMEGRIPLPGAIHFMVVIDTEALGRAVFAFATSTWWAFKAYRLLALMLVYRRQLRGSPYHRISHPALLLTAAIPLLANSIHSTIDTMPSSREVMGAIFPRADRSSVLENHLPFPIRLTPLEAGDDSEDEVEDIVTGGATYSNAFDHLLHPAESIDEEEEEEEEEEGQGGEQDQIVAELLSEFRSGGDLIPHAPYGALFTIPLRHPFPQVPRFINIRAAISDRAFYRIFGVNRDDLLDQLRANQVADPADPTRVSNRRKQQAIPAPSERSGLFNLQNRGFTVAPVALGSGSDLGSDAELEGEDHFSQGLDAGLERLWAQSLVDWLQVCPNPNRTQRNNDQRPYTVLNSLQRSNATVATYRDLDLSATFRDVQWRFGTDKEFRAVFDNLFTAKGRRKSGAIQNYGTTNYYPMWVDLMDRLESQAASAARDSVYSLFSTLNWIPFAKADRIWETRVTAKNFNRPPGADPSKPAPRILVKQGKRPTWNGQPLPR